MAAEDDECFSVIYAFDLDSGARKFSQISIISYTMTS